MLVLILGDKESLCDFWATVCKTVRSMLSNRCLSVYNVGNVAKRLDGSR